MSKKPLVKVGIFFASLSGATGRVAERIQAELPTGLAEIHDIYKCSRKTFEQYDVLFLGSPTYKKGYPDDGKTGELHEDWLENNTPLMLSKVNFKGKYVALFGSGDQKLYGANFCDALGIMAEFYEEHGATLVGKWPTVGYIRCGLLSGGAEKGKFMGLAIDEINQPKETDKRVNRWVKQVTQEVLEGIGSDDWYPQE